MGYLLGILPVIQFHIAEYAHNPKRNREWISCDQKYHEHIVL
jgi:hypothetical protein